MSGQCKPQTAEYGLVTGGPLIIMSHLELTECQNSSEGSDHLQLPSSIPVMKVPHYTPQDVCGGDDFKDSCLQYMAKRYNWIHHRGF